MKGRSPYWLWLGLLLLLGLFSQRDRIGHSDAGHGAPTATTTAITPAEPAAAGDQTANDAGRDSGAESATGDDGSEAFARAFAEHRSNIQLSGSGRVIKVLPDDNQGSRHQRLLVRLGPDRAHGQVILIAHNIDLAPRVEDISAGDTLAFLGEYEWSEKGGVLHWTHRDPGGRHAAGWLRHNGHTYR